MPTELTIDGQGQLWFSARKDRKLVKFDPVSERFDEFELPGKGVPEGLAVDSAGNIWYCDKYKKRVGRYSPKDKGFIEFDLVGGDRAPVDITVAASNKVWFTVIGTNELGVIDGNGIVKVESPKMSISIDETEKICLSNYPLDNSV